MALIKSISGIRGTIGGTPGTALTAIDIVKFASAFGSIISNTREDKSSNAKIVIGRDGRISGQMVSQLVINSLISLGIDVIDLGYSTTPTVEIATKAENADGGIIITASHNPKEWNALKLLNREGEFINAAVGAEVLSVAQNEQIVFAGVDRLGQVEQKTEYLKKHIDLVLQYPLVNQEAIEEKNYKVVVDCINSTGALIVPSLLAALGVGEVIVLNGEVTGKFAHNPEPLPEHLNILSREVVKQKADFGIAVDPDVDRLCFVCEDGSMFGEEYTLVAIADYFLQNKVGNTVSNMSSTKALKEITLKHGAEYFPSAVGEVNVVDKMKQVNAVIGGEGNGGIIVPDFHFGRDALIGIALFLSHFANFKKGLKSFRANYPEYFISKNKVELENGLDVNSIFEKIKKKYKNNPVNTEDGLKIEFDSDWVHLRTSNTEPIIRIYAESNFETTANNIAKRLMADIKEYSSTNEH
ncbi:MAG: phosphoglucosamine mutase [Candidatus Dadabacteria bacterium]